MPFCALSRINAWVKAPLSRMLLGAPTERMARGTEIEWRRSSVSLMMSAKGRVVAMA